mmetsp:Transcript_17742/g.21283  ORF Transcript_17742/g.21283 Transcript_17742/m.21283 type:complete len:542 (-) Transcript_17742:139-1764(-)|eukprot:CAMPEP_0197852668 /NCGR_PEP_ID=MMETSP1438-20131217/21181_1 /TAXON_ID=1461541 /ORGANISM="Pterosperma sp., Strain CCMP1384" /LENGTH=541 /DNA_ID=CAMNT_0043466825 /DNA_START=75 /DNA_END=1700 /DNA_ORIENTATION=+
MDCQGVLNFALLCAVALFGFLLLLSTGEKQPPTLVAGAEGGQTFRTELHAELHKEIERQQQQILQQQQQLQQLQLEHARATATSTTSTTGLPSIEAATNQGLEEPQLAVPAAEPELSLPTAVPELNLPTAEEPELNLPAVEEPQLNIPETQGAVTQTVYQPQGFVQSPTFPTLPTSTLATSALADPEDVIGHVCPEPKHCGTCAPSPVGSENCRHLCWDFRTKCQNKVVPINLKATVNGKTFKQEPGQSGATILQGDGPEGKFVVKFHPDGKVDSISVLSSLQKLIDECGSPSYYTRSSVRSFRVKAKHRVGLVMDFARGTSLASVIGKQTEFSHNLLQKLVVAAGPHLADIAVLELLFAGGDTNPGNVFISEKGDIKIIDLDSYLERKDGNRCNSVFIPGSRNHVKRPAMRALDYRCHVPGGKIGTNYNPKIAKCINKFAGMKQKDVMAAYKLPYIQAYRLIKRATWLKTLGYEEAMTRASCGLENNESAPKSEKQRKPRDLLGMYEACCGPQKPLGKKMDYKTMKLYIRKKCSDVPKVP